jgi:predicted transposase YdaD
MAMKTDKLFYRIFLSQPELIAELVPGVPVCEYDYSAPVIKEKELRLDGVLMPIEASAPVVFLEAQMQRDEEFYSRFFAGIFLYLHQYKVARDWRGLLILQNRDLDLGPDASYTMELGGRVHRLYLDDLLTEKDLSPNLSILRLLALPDNDQEGAAQAARAILKNPPDDAEFRRRLDLVEAILVNKFRRLSPEEIGLMLDLREASVRDTRFFQDVLQEGLVTGREEGREEGKVALTELVLGQLARRCGLLPIEVQAKIRGLAMDQVKVLGDALLDFVGMVDLEAWLETIEVELEK